jgi:hypothetical protein
MMFGLTIGKYQIFNRLNVIYFQELVAKTEA